MRYFVATIAVVFCFVCIAPRADSTTRRHQYPIAPVKERFSFFKERTQLPVPAVDANGKASVIYKEVDAWKVYFRHQTLRGYMDLEAVKITFVDANGRRLLPLKNDKHFSSDLHRLIIEASVDIASMPKPKYVVIDTPESKMTYPVDVKKAG